MTPTATSTTKIIEQIKQPTPITVAHGDGIGPEIMSATLRILEAAEAKLAIETVEIGEAVFHRGFSAGIEPETWDSIRRTKVFLKAPITTPQGGGFKSLNVTVRKSLGLFANVRPTVAFAPFVETAHPNMNVVIIRENEEDLYAGIEHRQTDDVYQCLKLITRPGCERIVRYAFEYARSNNRKKVTCMTKDNIMKLTDGLFHKVFNEIGAEYPEIAQDHWIIDIGMAKAATTPEIFDVIVIPNLYGDIISDVIAEVAGSVGMAPSSNVGEQVAMFEAIHGSAPMIAGQNIANPSGLILSAVMMLVHVGQAEVATKIHNAWLRTIEDGVHTGDIFTEAHSSSKVGTSEFTDAVISRLGQQPTVFDKVAYLNRAENTPIGRYFHKEPEVKQVVGIDIFVQWNGSADELAKKIATANSEQLKLQMITNRGVKVWPEGFAETFCTDHWRCRFITEPYEVIAPSEIMGLMQGVFKAELDFIKSETLCLFNGQPGFSLGQGQ